MLVLSRNKSQAVLIGTAPHQVRVTVNNIAGGRVVLGFDADRAIPIVREELAAGDGQWPLGTPVKKGAKGHG